MAQPFKKSIRKNNGLKKLIRVITILIALVVLFLIASNFMFKYFENLPKQEPTEKTQEPLPLPDKQGEPEITKLNPDPQVKEGW